MFFTATTPDHFVTLLYGLRMVGVGMVMMPLTTSAMNAVPVNEVAQEMCIRDSMKVEHMSKVLEQPLLVLLIITQNKIKFLKKTKII